MKKTSTQTFRVFDVTMVLHVPIVGEACTHVNNVSYNRELTCLCIIMKTRVLIYQKAIARGV